MDTSFPEGETAALTFELKKKRRFTVAFRRPAWAGEGFAIKVNGAAVKGPGPAGSYVQVERTWRTGDRVELVLPKTLRLEPLPDNPRRAAILWGPLVLAGDLGPLPQEWFGEESQRPSPKRPPRPTTPVLVAPGPALTDWIKPVEGRPGDFRTVGAGRDRDVELVPFYRLQRRWYAAYWDILTPREWDERAASLAAAREAAARLEAATVAFAQPGQMQAERDLNMRGGQTSPVQLQGRFGRRAVDWFSLDLAVDPAAPLKLVVTYNRDERADRAFAVLVDGRKIGEGRVARRAPQEPEGFFDVAYDIPADLVAGKKKVTVRFEGLEGRETANVFGLRIVRAGDRP
jgi:hypothetical protein